MLEESSRRYERSNRSSKSFQLSFNTSFCMRYFHNKKLSNGKFPVADASYLFFSYLGKGVGFVTTSRVQHATPAAMYAKTVNKRWHSDADMPDDAKDQGCKDISTQMVDVAKKFRV